MRELTAAEINEVAGGWFLGIGAGAAIGGFSAWGAGGNGRQIAAATALGGASGAMLNFAGAAATGGLIVRGSFAVRGVGLGVASSWMSFGPSGGGAVQSEIEVLEKSN